MIEEELFHRAQEKSTLAEQLAFLDQVCADQPDLRQRVERLLRSHRHEDSFLHAGATVDPPVTEAPGTVIGPYQLLEQIGEGGMGAVWMAQQTEPVKRRVAVKLIKAGMDSKQVIARFEAERQALALMDHPNIARVLDGGTTDAGRPYFVMDLVKGVPITKYCDENHLTPRQRLELFLPVCQAVQHAHQKGIIHRDLKPSNVLVALYDGKPVPKVIDFGVAKATGQPLTEQTLVTGFGAIVGTLEYMSPEQAEFNQLDIDTRSDIYSLGVLLYELLTGSPPFSKKELEQVGMLETLRMIREQEPTKPSAKLSISEALPTLAANRGTEPAKLTKLVRGELDWIVMKALEKDRNRRYESASALAADVQRYLADLPVQACPPSVGYRLRKFARRNKTALTVASVVLLAVFLTVGGLGWMVRDRSMRQAETTRRVRESLTRVRRWVDENNLSSARQELAEARGRVGSDATALRDVTPDLEDLESELEAREEAQERFRHFFEFIDQAHERETGPGAAVAGSEGPHVGPDPREAIPLILRALSLYGVMEHDDWSARLEQEQLESGQVIQIRRGVYEKLLWLAEDQRSRRQDHLTGADLDGAGSARRALAYLKKAQAIAPPTRALFWIRSRCLEQLGDQQAAKADSQRAREAPTLTATDHFLAGRAAYLAAQGGAWAENKAEGVREFEAALRLDPSHYWSLMLLGYCLCDMGEGQDRAEAVRVFTGCIALRPRHAHAYFCRATALVHLGRTDQAMADLDAALALKPDHEMALFARGELYMELRRYDRACADLDAALTLKPDHERVLHSRGMLYMKLRRYDRARADLVRAVKLEPDDWAAWSNLGITHEMLGEIDLASSAYRKSIEINPSFVYAHTRLGDIYFSQGRYDQALTSLRRAVELDPKSAQAHSNLGNVLFKRGKVDEAIAYHRKAIEIDASFVLAHKRLGNIYFFQGRYDKALACYRKAIDLDPKDASAHNNLGNVYWKQHKNDEAEVCYRKAIEFDPKSANAHSNLGNVLSERGKVDEAIAYHRKAIELDPNYAQPYNNLGTVYTEQGKWDEAIACYRKAIDLDPKSALYHDSLGALLCDRKHDYDGAIAAFRKAIDLNPKSAPSHSNLGGALVKLGRTDEAIASYRTAIELDPKYALAYYNLGYSLVIKGGLDEAVTCYRKFIELEPNHANACECMHHVAVTYAKVGRHADAVKLHEETLTLRKAHLGPDHPETLMSMWGLAEGLIKLDRGAEALPIIDDCIRRAKGKDVNPNLVVGMMRNRLLHFQKKKDLTGCRETAELFENLGRADAKNLYNAACMRSVIAAVIRSNDKSAAAGKDASTEADRAMGWLRKAVAAGYKDIKEMKQDGDLDALRERKDFKMLLDDLETKQKEKAP
jgi:tetratricopeptide (TPR) repeat protein/tRNA A-37 threonylcarbamoyl transferase component Bud32